jgi:hypothetical protein
MKLQRIYLWAVVAALIGASLAACGRTTEPSQPGPAVASLTTPARDDGAVLAILTGTTFGDVVPASSSYRVYWRLASPTEIRVVVVGNLGAGPLFSVNVPDVRKVGTLQATVVDVASRGDSTRASLSGYSLALVAGAAP